MRGKTSSKDWYEKAFHVGASGQRVGIKLELAGRPGGCAAWIGSKITAVTGAGGPSRFLLFKSFMIFFSCYLGQH
jgi:hypothetical protein